MEQKLRTYFSQLSHLGNKEKIADALRVLVQDELSQRSQIPHGNDLEHLEKALGNYYHNKECNYILTLLENFTRTGSFESGDRDPEKALSKRYLKILSVLNELFEVDTAHHQQNK